MFKKYFRGDNNANSGEFPAQGPATRSSVIISFICAWINNWVNNREAGDLRRHRAHYDVTVMMQQERFVKVHNSIG